MTLALVKTSFIANYGMNSVLKPFVSDVKNWYAVHTWYIYYGELLLPDVMHNLLKGALQYATVKLYDRQLLPDCSRIQFKIRKCRPLFHGNKK